MYLYKITFSLLLFAGFAYGQQTNIMEKFSSIQECTAGFAKATDKTAADTSTSYCSTHVLSDIEICIAPKIKQHIAENKLGSFSNLTNSEQIALIGKKRFECQKLAQQDAITADQQKKADEAKKAGSATTMIAGGAAAAGAAALAANNNAQNTQTALQLAQQGSKIAEAIDKKTGVGPNRNSSNTTQLNTSEPKSSTETAAVEEARAKSKSEFQNNEHAYRAQQEAERTRPQDDVAGVDAAVAANNGSVKTLTPEQTEAATQQLQSMPGGFDKQAGPGAVAAGNDAAAGIKGEVGLVVRETPQLEGPAAKLAANADGGGASAQPTEITSNAQNANSTLRSEINTATQSTGKPAFGPGISDPFSSMGSATSAFNGQIEKYIASKQTCANLAEKAEFLCVEQSSPGAIAAKEVMNAAGPLISIIASAQKTCSTTAKVTKLVTTGLMVAKGVCVAAKLACDTSCASAASQLKVIQQSINSKLATAAFSDQGSSATACGELAMGAAACFAHLTTRASAATSMIGALNSALSKESAPTPGTSTQLVVKCQSYVKDIALFAVQALGTLMASQNAQKCEKQLSGTNGNGAITTQQYCEKPENTAMQICKCQKNNLAAGCPGAIAAGTDPALNKDSLANNIQLKNGNSAFGGGFKNTAPTSGLGKAGVGIDGQVADGVPKSGADSAGGSAGYAGGSGSGGGVAGAGASAPNGSSDPSLTKDSPDKKKWSFGSFGSLGGGGGFFGGGSTSASKNSGLASKQLESIKRQMASEKISAEVSSASGKSNWEKVRNMYLIKEGSFIFGQ